MSPSSYFFGKRVLITGGLGFLGSSLAHALVDLDAKVMLYDALLPEYGGNLFNIETIKKRVTVIRADIRDHPAMEQAVADQDIIFNIAAQTSHVDSMRDPFLDLDVNGRGQLTILESCRKINPNVVVIYAGSRAQYGVVPCLPATEDTPMNPIDIYGAHKILGEHYHWIYQRISGMKVVSLRLTNIYGPRHQMKHAQYGVQNFFVRRILDNQSVPIFGDGTQLRDFLYVDDAVDAFLRAASTKEAYNEAFVISSGSPIALVDFVKQAIAKAQSGSIEFKEYTKERKMIESGDFYGDPGKFMRATLWKPRVSLEEGLKKTIQFYRTYRAHYWTR